jgi:hypothetical protein
VSGRVGKNRKPDRSTKLERAKSSDPTERNRLAGDEQGHVNERRTDRLLVLLDRHDLIDRKSGNPARGPFRNPHEKDARRCRR